MDYKGKELNTLTREEAIEALRQTLYILDHERLLHLAMRKASENWLRTLYKDAKKSRTDSFH